MCHWVFRKFCTHFKDKCMSILYSALLRFQPSEACLVLVVPWARTWCFCGKSVRWATLFRSCSTATPPSTVTTASVWRWMRCSLRPRAVASAWISSLEFSLLTFSTPPISYSAPFSDSWVSWFYNGHFKSAHSSCFLIVFIKLWYLSALSEFPLTYGFTVPIIFSVGPNLFHYWNFVPIVSPKNLYHNQSEYVHRLSENIYWPL